MSDEQAAPADWRARIQAAAERHLRDLIRDAVHIDGKAGPGGHPEPYCSCVTCEVREAITGAWPLIEQMVAAAAKALHDTSRVGEVEDPVCLNPKAVDGTAAPCGTCPACRRVEL